MDAFMRRIAVWRETERDAPAASALAVKERYDEAFAMPDDQMSVENNVTGGVRFFDADTIDLGLSLVRSGAAERPLLLILADDCFPGGCVATGSGAQEEAMFRRTNLCRVLSMSDYPIRDDEAIYAPGVVVFKNGERHATDPFGTCPPSTLDFVACPGLRHPMLTSDGRLYEADEARLAVKIRTVLQIAARHGHDAVVLGALGCGAWKCPPHHVAEVFARELSDAIEKKRFGFRRIDFAILKGTAAGYITVDHAAGARRDNFDVFTETFSLGVGPLPGPPQAKA